MAAPIVQSFEMAAALADLTNWLIQQGLENTPTDVWLAECCQRINAAGIPLMRVNLSTRAHHPEIGAVAFRWHRECTAAQRTINQSNAGPPADEILQA